MHLRFMVFVLLLSACGEVRSFEQTSVQFQRDRHQLERLAEAALACEGASSFPAQKNERADCAGEVARQLHRMGYRSASVDEGRRRVAFVNGDDGAPIGGVISGIAYHRVPGPPRHGEIPLTKAPAQWFYFQHD